MPAIQCIFKTAAASAFAFLLHSTALAQTPPALTIHGDKAVWRTLTVDIVGPSSDEKAIPNPFSDYSLSITFSQNDLSYTVPGYFAACGNAAETSCTEGNIWRTHFTPDKPGDWKYKVSFIRGKDAALSGNGKEALALHGRIGNISIAESELDSTDPRDKGRLQYDGTRYLKYAATSAPFFKAGADAPENMLAYDGFDSTPSVKGLRKSWAPHIQDAKDVNLEKYGWNEKGAGILGAISYLADQGLNAVSFLTFNITGDDQNVFPHLMKVDLETYENYEKKHQQWSMGVHHDRFDVSKLDQWQRVLSYGNDRGMFLHFKLQEVENDDLINGGDTGRERQLYLREIIARFGHFLALNWNVGEENNLPPHKQIAMIDKIAELDPYGHLRVMHTYPQEKFRYNSLLGNQSALTGLSLQGGRANFTDIHPDVTEWTLKSAASGKPWVISYDEAGGAGDGAAVDKQYDANKLITKNKIEDNRKNLRGRVLWATFLSGGTGVEYYYGYQTGCTDLNCEDHRSRANKWNDASIALEIMNTYVGSDVSDMVQMTGTVLPHLKGYVLGIPDEKYIAYLHNANEVKLRLTQWGDTYKVSWFNPSLSSEPVKTEMITADKNKPKSPYLRLGEAPDKTSQDWVIVIEKQTDR